MDNQNEKNDLSKNQAIKQKIMATSIMLGFDVNSEAPRRMSQHATMLTFRHNEVPLKYTRMYGSKQHSPEKVTGIQDKLKMDYEASKAMYTHHKSMSHNTNIKLATAYNR